MLQRACYLCAEWLLCDMQKIHDVYAVKHMCATLLAGGGRKLTMKPQEKLLFFSKSMHLYS